MKLSERCSARDTLAIAGFFNTPATYVLAGVLDEWQAEVEAKTTELEARIAQLEEQVAELEARPKVNWW